MARYLYAASPADYVIDAATGLPKPSVVVTIYTAVTGGTQVTDLLTAAGSPITTVTTDSAGGFRFQGPDGEQDTLWASVAGGVRSAVNVGDIGTRFAAIEADVVAVDADARLTAVEADIAALPVDIAADIGSLESRATISEADIVALEGKVTTKISVGTVAPTSPTTNDLWVDTN